MVFSSPLFLFGFLPIFLVAYYLNHPGARNWVALVGSLLFYAWGAPVFVLILIPTTLFDYYVSRRIAESETTSRRKAWLAACLVVDLGSLLYFKYANFFIEESNRILAAVGIEAIDWVKIALPIGISFFTFQKISYVVDVYRRRVEPARSPVDCLLYVALFPQLIAGPIVRYQDIHQQLRERLHSSRKFLSGVQRFCLGLAKKILIADMMASVADPIFASPVAALPTSYVWLGAVCYCLQIYFDFSGYSDMAIGLGRMMGFEFMENFRRPYMALSITDFWRRWHISLSRWMREYLYIPLGGNKGSARRTYINLWIVFLISGFWHGAAWNFIVWGAFHGLLLTLDKLCLLRWMERLPTLLRRLHLLFLVLISWVVFRAESLGQAMDMLGRMLLLSTGPDPIESGIVSEVVLSHRFVFVLLVASAICIYPWSAYLRKQEEKILASPSAALGAMRFAATSTVFLLTILAMANATHSPFIYFRF